MGEVHELVMHHGREGALALARDSRERRAIDVAAKILTEESDEIGVTYSGFCLTSLPHRRLSDESIWKRKSPRFTLLVEPGLLPLGGKTHMFGVPYGSRARLILIYLQTQAVRSSSPEVELGRSMRWWMSQMGVTTGGKAYADVREQACRVAACRLTFYWDAGQGGGTDGFKRDSIVEAGLAMAGPLLDDERQASLWQETVRLSPSFYQALKSHPVPVWEPAIKEISNQSLTLDVYVWLAYRLHSLKVPTPVSWPALHGQFGAGYQKIAHFKPRFLDALRMACAVYPEAEMRDAGDRGIVLMPSRPPVPERTLPLR